MALNLTIERDSNFYITYQIKLFWNILVESAESSHGWHGMIVSASLADIVTWWFPVESGDTLHCYMSTQHIQIHSSSIHRSPSHWYHDLRQGMVIVSEREAYFLVSWPGSRRQVPQDLNRKLSVSSLSVCIIIESNPGSSSFIALYQLCHGQEQDWDYEKFQALAFKFPWYFAVMF